MKLFASGSKQTNQLESTKTFFIHSFIFLICSFCSVVVVGKQNKNKLFFSFSLYYRIQCSFSVCLVGTIGTDGRKTKLISLKKETLVPEFFFFGNNNTIAKRNETKNYEKHYTNIFQKRRKWISSLDYGRRKKTLFSQLQSDNFIRICFEKFALLIYNEKWIIFIRTFQSNSLCGIYGIMMMMIIIISL